jgi:hypothetical protein
VSGILAAGRRAVLPPLALLWRIKIEEAEMARVLGEPYRAYSARTKRLIPLDLVTGSPGIHVVPVLVDDELDRPGTGVVIGDL